MDSIRFARRTEIKKENEPNKAMERTPVAVTVHALHGQRHLPSCLIFDVRQIEPSKPSGSGRI